MIFAFFDKAKQRKLKDPAFLKRLLDEDLKLEKCKDLDISETRYLASFIPLFHGKVLDRQQTAGKLDMSYGTLRNFLLEEKIKKLTEGHIDEFSDLYIGTLAKYYFRAKGNKKLRKEIPKIGGDYDKLIDEASQYYSRPFIQAISKKLMGTIRPKNPKDRRWRLTRISRKKIFEILEERIKEIGDTKTYLRIRLERIQDMLLNMGDDLENNKDYIKQGKPIKPESINQQINQQIKCVEEIKTFINEFSQKI